MCGIAGEIRSDGQAASVSAVSAMADVLAPRGPDGSGVYAQGPRAFGHRRLKIIDLSEHAQQPMVDSALGLAIVFNGAIYNYPELREALEAKGYSFFSTGDTEVMLKAYPRLGRGLRRAFPRHVRLRDLGARHGPRHAGPRPARHQAALLRRDAGRVPLRLDPAGAAGRRRHRHRDRSGRAPPLHDVPRRRAGAAHDPQGRAQAAAGDGDDHRSRTAAATTREYWTLEFGPRNGDAARSEDEWRELVLETLRTAVERRLVADVPVGVLLSGGVDSSLIVGLLAEAGQHGLQDLFDRLRDGRRRGGRRVQVFRHRRQAFRHRPHQDLHRFEPRAARARRAASHAMSEPMVSHDNIGFYLLSEEVAKHVKVVQSGQGADEIFAGYHWYPPMLDSNDPVGDYASVFFDRDYDEYRQAVDPAMADGDHSPPLSSSEALRRARRRAADRQGAAARHHHHAGRRPGQAGRQHDHGLGPGGPRAVPRPRAGRARRTGAGRAQGQGRRQVHPQGSRRAR